MTASRVMSVALLPRGPYISYADLDGACSLSLFVFTSEVVLVLSYYQALAKNAVGCA